MSEYVPTTDEVCGGWMASGPPASTVVRAIEFARWLDQVRAAARREGQTEAWDEGYRAGSQDMSDLRAGRLTFQTITSNPYWNGDRHVDQ